MAYQYKAAKKNTTPWSDPPNLPLMTHTTSMVTTSGHIKSRITHLCLSKQSDWMDWALSDLNNSTNIMLRICLANLRNPSQLQHFYHSSGPT